MSPRIAETSVPVLDTIAQRWSPRAFEGDHTLPEGALRGTFEAARWAASAGNSQPWRFIIARRGSESFAKVSAALFEGNKVWAESASALIVNIAETVDEKGDAHPWAQYDLGQAVANYVVQAHSEGLYVHQMGGFDRAAISSQFQLDEHYEVVSVAAIGALGSPEQLSEALYHREVAPRTRMPLEEIVIVND